MGERITKDIRELQISSKCKEAGYEFLGWESGYTNLQSKIILSNSSTNNVWETSLFNFIKNPVDPSEKKINKILIYTKSSVKFRYYKNLRRVGCTLSKRLLFSFECGKCLQEGLISSRDIKLDRLQCKCGNSPRDKLYGIGIKDELTSCDNCPYYHKWSGIIRRCYSDAPSDRGKFYSYKDCKVCKEWLTFSKFKQWCISQEVLYDLKVEDYNIDKDLKSKGTKGFLYSPDFCTFVTSKVNSFMTDNYVNRGDYLLGVHKKEDGKFYAQCKNPFERYSNGKTKVVHLGSFTREVDAHVRWAEEKYNIAIRLTNCNKNNRNNVLGLNLVFKYKSILDKAKELI